MNIIIPMAGIGKRLRPHTLTTPKPLIEIAGKPIVEHLVYEIIDQLSEPVKNIGFIIGRFGSDIEEKLLQIAENAGAKGFIFYQDEALGTAHAILCAKPLLNGPAIIAFADTLFRADFKLDEQVDGVLWVEKVKDPSAFGVVELNDKNQIVSFVEKPETFVSDLAMIGIYYFKQSEVLKAEMQYLIDNNIINGSEYQLPDALRAMVEKGAVFIPGTVKEWLDCGNYKATINTNKQWLIYKKDDHLIDESVKLNNSIIVKPCYIGPDIEIINSVIGPFVTLGGDNKIENTVLENSLVGKNTKITNKVISTSMIGNNTIIEGANENLSVGDFNEIKT
jgi:glucose-1-phosphate thymidylyltransferase